MRVEDGFFFYMDKDGKEQCVRPSSTVDVGEFEMVKYFERAVILTTEDGHRFLFEDYLDKDRARINKIEN